jgi:predicted lipid carrier protein YhbT
MKTTPKRPQLPQFLTLPLRLVPGRLHGAVAARLLERVFAAQRTDGELDFMEGKSVCIRVLDAGIDLGISAGANGFETWPLARATDLVIEGTTYDFLLLITGREDPDTLFFQRRLRMSGDTALGVHLKNFLASVDPDSLPLAALVRPGLDRGLLLYERFLG